MWALGATFFALMTGHYVHAAGDCNPPAITKGLRKLESFPECAGTTKIITKLLAWDAKDRYKPEKLAAKCAKKVLAF
jgi:hypothetical protein